MKPIYMYMDEAIEMGAVKNDSELAAKLGLSRASVSAWRNGKTAPDDEQAIALARLIGKPEIELMAEAAAHRAKTSEARTYWERIAKYSATATGVAATWVVSLFVVMMLAGYSPQSEAKTFVTYPTETQAQTSASTSPVFIM